MTKPAGGGGPTKGDPAKDGYLLEFRQIGNAVKVSAIDPVTGTEVSIVGSALSPQSQLANTAVAKLKFMIAKKTPVHGRN
jgi:hypothetical protein